LLVGVPAGEEACHELFDDLVLADDDPGDLRAHAAIVVRQRRDGFDLVARWWGVCRHAGLSWPPAERARREAPGGGRAAAGVKEAKDGTNGRTPGTRGAAFRMERIGGDFVGIRDRMTLCTTAFCSRSSFARFTARFRRFRRNRRGWSWWPTGSGGSTSAARG